MKTLVKFVFPVMLFMLFSTATAQVYNVELGYVQPIRYSSEMSHRYFNGVRAGATVDFDIPVNYLTFETGLLGSFTWSKDIQKYSKSFSDSTVFRTKGIYLDIPIHIKISYKPHKDVKLFVFAGPNVNLGLYQPQEVSSTLSNPTTMKWLEDLGIKEGKSDLHKGDLRRVNFQFDAGGGVQWRKYALKGGYSFGLNDLSRKTADKQRLSGWYAAFVYEF